MKARKLKLIDYTDCMYLCAHVRYIIGPTYKGSECKLGRDDCLWCKKVCLTKTSWRRVREIRKVDKYFRRKGFM